MTRSKKKIAIPRDLQREAAEVRKVAEAERQLKRETKKPKKSGTTTGKILSGIVSTAARAIPLVGNFLSPVLGELSEKAGDALQGWVTGSGEYEVQQNSFVNPGQVPLEVRNSPNDFTMIRKREYIGTLFSSSNVGEFAVTDFSVNLGLPEVAPWGQSTARAYREYVLSGALVEFESTTSPIAPAGGSNLGSVMGAVEYNSSKTHPFVNESQMENQDHSVSKATSASWVMPIECAPDKSVMASGLFVRTGPLPVNQPAQFYDQCVFSIGTVGQPQASQNLGKLYFVYEAYLRKATILSTETQYQSDLFVITTPIRADPMGGVRTPPSFVPAPLNSLRGTIDRDMAGRYNFADDAPAGDYEVRYYAATMTVASPGPTSIAFTSSPNVTIISSLEQDGGLPALPGAFDGVYYAGMLQVATGSNLIMCCRVRLTGPSAGGWFALNTSTTPDWSAAGASLLISPVDPNVVFSDGDSLLSTPAPRVALYENTRRQHLEAIEAADSASDVRAAIAQFRNFLGFRKVRARQGDLAVHLPPSLFAKVQGMNFGEERQVDIDQLIKLAQAIVERQPAAVERAGQFTTMSGTSRATDKAQRHAELVAAFLSGLDDDSSVPTEDTQ